MSPVGAGPGPIAEPPAGLLDALGGQPMIPEARSAWTAAVQQAWADPTRLHHAGRRAGLVLEAARRSLAQGLAETCSVPIEAEQVWFAGSVRVALAAAISGAIGADPRPIVASAVETAAVLDTVEGRSRLDEHTSPPRIIGVDALGRVDLDEFIAAMEAGASGACLQIANAEVGTRQPISAVGAAADRRRLPLICDATGIAGRAMIPDGWTHLVVDARDWAGPPGVAALIVRPDRPWSPPAGSARGWLAGPADTAGAAAAAMALERVAPALPGEAAIAHSLISRIRTRVAQLPDVQVLGDPVDRIPHVVTFSVLYVAGEQLVHELDRRGFAVASGSACVSEEARPSHVLAAMGAYTSGSVRVSLPIGVRPNTVDEFLQVLPEAISAVRPESAPR